MQENRKVTIGISPKPEILNPKCSCTECDSVSCFAKRQTDETCVCGVCKNSKFCFFYNTNLSLSKIDKKNIAGESKFDSKNIKDIKQELLQHTLTSEVIKSETIYELDKNNHMKVISKKQSKISYKNVNSKDRLGEDKHYGLPKVHSVEITDCRKEVSPSTAKLSAQVMDLPYKDFQNSIGKSHFPTAQTNILSPYDIFNRIKEVYKACSCKVCECIVGKSLQNYLCKCKPCECNDCASFNRRVKSFAKSDTLVPRDDDGCPCIRCDRGSCKGIANGKTREAQECDCVGVLQCNYLKNESSPPACNCEPCQCIECAPRSIHRHRELIVAPVGEEYQHRNVCQCSPCECFECGRGFRLSSNRHNEMSTSINRHPHCLCETCINEACIPDGNESCRCERQGKVMSKPFQRDSHDYDIRRTTVTYDNAQKQNEVNNYDTIAMFAAITNAYLKPEASNKQCDCDQCECLVCKYKLIRENSSKVFEPIQKNELRNKINNNCPSDSKFCDKHNTKTPNLKKVNVCGCMVCDCITCDGLANSNAESNKCDKNTKKLKSTFSAKGDCRCIPCECADCEKLMTSCVGDICLCSNCRCENCMQENYSNEEIYPVKRGERLTPSLFRRKIKDAFIESCINTLEANEEILKQPVTFQSSIKKPPIFKSVQKTKTQYDTDTYYRNRYECYSNNYKRTETVKHAHIAKCINGLNLPKRNEPTLESNESACSSTSFLKESGSITHSRCKLKSWASSCNSSGHDNPNYLFHFPKTTVETCVNDVMQFDSDKNTNINLTPMTLSSKNNNINQHNRDNCIPPPKFLPMRTIFSQEDPTDTMDSQPHNTECNYFKYSQNFDDYPDSQNIDAKPKYYGKTKSKQANSEPKPRKVTPRKHDKHLTVTKNLGSFALVEDYERVQNTLQEARAFSLHLVQLLEKYEKANREFESVSKKINKSNDSLSNKYIATNRDNDLKTTFDIVEVPTKEQEHGSSGSSTEELVAINMNANNIDEGRRKNAHDHDFENSSSNNYEYLSEPCSENNDGRDESGDDIIIKTIETLNTITEEKEPVDVSHKGKKKRVTTKLNRRYNKMYKRSFRCSKKLNSLTNSSNVAVDATNAIDTQTQEMDLPFQEIRNIDIDKRNDFGKEIKINLNAEVKPTAADIHILKQEKKSTTELRAFKTEKFTKDHLIFQKDVVLIKQPLFEHSRQIVEMKGEEPWPVSKKNFCLATNDNTHGRRLLAPLEGAVKVAAQTTLKQPSDVNATYLYENKALTKLHFEVKKLLDMPILQTFDDTLNGQKDDDTMFNRLSKTSSSQTIQGSEDSHNIENIARVTAASSENSCEALKVNFLNVRRVSDHTVLVKWNTPRVLNNVVGYELLVDGRAVQNIFSPSRRMAVVTCLPHNDKVLLTVRTVVSSPCHDHCPAATVIYQPKIK